METKKVINLIILDASGSMSTIYNQALGGVNETLGAIRELNEGILRQTLCVVLLGHGCDDECHVSQ